MDSNKKQDGILKIIRSNKLFEVILKDILPEGESPPYKQGKRGNLLALAKTDLGFQKLLEHKNKKVRDLCNARVAAKSWINHIKRVEKLKAQAKADNGKLRVSLKYAGAHTGRWSGSGGINLQNLGGAGRGKAIHPLIGAIRGLLYAG